MKSLVLIQLFYGLCLVIVGQLNRKIVLFLSVGLFLLASTMKLWSSVPLIEGDQFLLLWPDFTWQLESLNRLLILTFCVYIAQNQDISFCVRSWGTLLMVGACGALLAYASDWSLALFTVHFGLLGCIFLRLGSMTQVTQNLEDQWKSVSFSLLSLMASGVLLLMSLSFLWLSHLIEFESRTWSEHLTLGLLVFGSFWLAFMQSPRRAPNVEILKDRPLTLLMNLWIGLYGPLILTLFLVRSQLKLFVGFEWGLVLAGLLGVFHLAQTALGFTRSQLTRKGMGFEHWSTSLSLLLLLCLFLGQAQLALNVLLVFAFWILWLILFDSCQIESKGKVSKFFGFSIFVLVSALSVACLFLGSAKGWFDQVQGLFEGPLFLYVSVFVGIGLLSLQFGFQNGRSLINVKSSLRTVGMFFFFILFWFALEYSPFLGLAIQGLWELLWTFSYRNSTFFSISQVFDDTQRLQSLRIFENIQVLSNLNAYLQVAFWLFGLILAMTLMGTLFYGLLFWKGLKKPSFTGPLLIDRTLFILDKGLVVRPLWKKLSFFCDRILDQCSWDLCASIFADWIPSFARLTRTIEFKLSERVESWSLARDSLRAAISSPWLWLVSLFALYCLREFQF